MFTDFVEDDGVALIGVEAAGKGLAGHEHGATIQRGSHGILHGAETLVLQDEDGQVRDTWSVSAGLDYPAVGPEHVHLATSAEPNMSVQPTTKRSTPSSKLARGEGIIAAFESCHAVAQALKLAESRRRSR